MKQCALCGKKVRFRTFKVKDGVICANCYQIASENYTRVVRQMKLSQLKSVMETATHKENNFKISRRIGQFVLFDDEHKLICLPNNIKFTAIKKDPEFYVFKDIQDAVMQIQRVKQGKKTCGTIFVLVNIFYKYHNLQRKILVLQQCIDTESTIFKELKKTAEKIVEQLNEVSGTHK